MMMMMMMYIAGDADTEGDDENVAALGLGELADLTIFNEADTSSYDVRSHSLAFVLCLFMLNRPSCYVLASISAAFVNE